METSPTDQIEIHVEERLRVIKGAFEQTRENVQSLLTSNSDNNEVKRPQKEFAS